MSYDKIRLRTGGKIPKLVDGDKLTQLAQKNQTMIAQYRQNHSAELVGLENDEEIMRRILAQPIDDSEDENRHFESLEDIAAKNQKLIDGSGFSTLELNARKLDLTSRGMMSDYPMSPITDTTQNSTVETTTGSSKGKDFGLAALNAADYMAQTTTGLFGGQMGVAGYEGMKDSITNAIESGDVAGGVIGALGGAQTIANSIVDQQLLRDKNFTAGSQTADQLVHGASSALMKSGNPYAIAAGAAIEGINFLSKAGGTTTDGFDVNINNSGYGTLNHQDAQSNRNFFSINSRKIKNQLKKRNDQVMMALSAAELSNDMAFQQEARMNNIQNTIQNNQIALAGGLETSTLGG